MYGHDQITSECLNGTWTNVADCQGKYRIAVNIEENIKIILEIPTCPKQDLLEIESQVENSYIHNGEFSK